MNELQETFDWSSLGEEPLPGELSDEAMLEAVLAQASAAPVASVPDSPRSPAWVRPTVVAAVIMLAAVLALMLAPSWTQALLGDDDDDNSLAPDVQVPEGDEQEAMQGHARARSVSKATPSPEPIVVEPEPEPEPEPIVAEPEETPQRKPVRNAPPASADDMLRSAQDAFASKDSAGAIRKYRSLLRAHPRSAQARAARLSLGRLELSAGRANKALAQFDRYLGAPGGSLRREARLGRIDALRKLGRKSAERSAIESFLADHPSTVHAKRLRARLEVLE